jgi:hypothetical protein
VTDGSGQVYAHTRALELAVGRRQNGTEHSAERAARHALHDALRKHSR